MKLDFSDINVLLIGDLMIDHYIMGTSNRMSPEAPVPVVISQTEYSIVGGAGNVAMNLSSLGANVTCVGAVGNDNWGKKLISILANKGISTKHVDVIQNHPTTLKQRIYSKGKQVARLDKEEILTDWDPKTRIKYEDFDVIVLSDYGKGVFDNDWLKYVTEAKKIKNTTVILDPKLPDSELLERANIITPNLRELQDIVDYIGVYDYSKNKLIDVTRIEPLITACNQIIKSFDNLDYVIAKKGADGITVIGKNNFVKHISAHNVGNPDVTGAGDTVISALSLAFIANNDIEFSAKFANAAASIVVGKLGTATTTVEEIKKLLLK